MVDDKRVEIVIRKKPALGLIPESPTGSAPDNAPASSSNYVPIRTGNNRNLIKILIILIILAAFGFGIYKFFPTATSFVLSGFGEKFDYTVTAKATETFYDKGIKEISIMEETNTKTQKIESDTTIKVFSYDGENLNEETTFQVSKDDLVRVEFDYFDGEGGSARVYTNGQKVYNDLRTDFSGIQLQYEAIIEQNEQRTMTQEGTARVSRNGKERKIAEITIVPEAKKDGELGEVTYDVEFTDENEQAHIEGYVSEGFLFAKYVSDSE